MHHVHVHHAHDLQATTRATPEVAPYPFTTLMPNLGVLSAGQGTQKAVMADLPGLIEGEIACTYIDIWRPPPVQTRPTACQYGSMAAWHGMCIMIRCADVHMWLVCMSRHSGVACVQYRRYWGLG